MITPKTYYEVCCDQCNDLLEVDEITAWQSVDDADDALHTYGWRRLPSGRILCDQCLTQTEEEQ